MPQNFRVRITANNPLSAAGSANVLATTPMHRPSNGHSSTAMRLESDSKELIFALYRAAPSA